MTDFMIYEIRNALRLEGHTIDKYSNRRMMAAMLNLDKKSTLKDLCTTLHMSYFSRENCGGYHDSEQVYLHYLEKDDTIHYNSVTEASEILGVNLVDTCRHEKIYEKILFIDGEKVVLSTQKTIDKSKSFLTCQKNKININLALSTRLGFIIDYDMSIVEMFIELGLNLPQKDLKKTLCEYLGITYYSSSFCQKTKSKPVVLESQEERLVFLSRRRAAQFLQIDHKTIDKIIKKHYRFPFWYQRYTIKYDE